MGLFWAGSKWPEQEDQEVSQVHTHTDLNGQVWKVRSTRPLTEADYKVVRRAGVVRIKPTGRERAESILALLGLALMTALMVGGLFFWIGVVQAWMRTH